MQSFKITLEKLCLEKFDKYGWILEPHGVCDFGRPRLKNWRLPFNSDADPRLQIMRYSNKEHKLSIFERHKYVTELRAPIGRAAAILVVAGEPSSDEVPNVESVRAFLLNGSTGIMFRKGVWHGVDCFPINSEYVDYLFLSDEETENEIEASKKPRNGKRTEIYDFSSLNLSFQIIDTEGLIV